MLLPLCLSLVVSCAFDAKVCQAKSNSGVKYLRCIVQSDSRSRNVMVVQSKRSLREMAFAEDATYINADCASTGAPKKATIKPCAILHACCTCNVIQWVDTDAAWTGKGGMFNASQLVMNKNTLILAGIDYKETREQARRNLGTYPGMFNAGLMTIKCSKKTMALLEQWLWFSDREGDDQAALQELSFPGSVWSKYIKYDFRLNGVHSEFINHFPGAYKRNFEMTRHLAEPAPIQLLHCNK